MPFLSEVKKNISSAQSTRKITQAMQLVAANKMKGFQKKALSARSYAFGLLSGLKLTHGSVKDLPFAEQRKEGSILFVLLTSDKGLCGALNNKLIDTLFTSEKWQGTKPDNRILITIGRKSYEAAVRAGIKVEKNYQGLNEQMDPLDALKIINDILQYWEESKCREIILISPHYVNPFTIHYAQKTYLPLGTEMMHSHFRWHGKNPLENAPPGGPEEADRLIFHEPSEEEVAETLSLQLVQTLFLQAFFELKASEYSSRMVAMKKATEAADELINNLSLQYNKLRQSIITQQIAELAGGSEALAEELNQDSYDSQF